MKGEGAGTRGGSPAAEGGDDRVEVEDTGGEVGVVDGGLALAWGAKGLVGGDVDEAITEDEERTVFQGDRRRARGG